MAENADARAPKADQAAVEFRIGEIYKMLLAGETSARIVHYAAEKWNLSERQTRTYTKRARARIAGYAKVDQEKLFALSLARLDSLYAAAVRVQDTKTALSVTRAIIDLAHLQPPAHAQPVTITTPADVLRIIEGELNATLTGQTTPERTRQIEALAGAALAAIEKSKVDERLTAIESVIFGEKKAP
jgi:hypothetical protein